MTRSSSDAGTGMVGLLAGVLAEHEYLARGPITGAWTCLCGVASINGKASLETLTTFADRVEQRQLHLAAVLAAALGERGKP